MSDIRLTASDIHFVHDILRLATAFQPQRDMRLRRVVFADRRGRRSLRIHYSLFIIHHSFARSALLLRTVGDAGPYGAENLFRSVKEAGVERGRK